MTKTCKRNRFYTYIYTSVSVFSFEMDTIKISVKHVAVAIMPKLSIITKSKAIATTLQ